MNKGSGLGLSQVFGFAHQSGGTVTIQSELGKGTTVAIYLPRSTAAVAEAEAEQDAALASGGSVLVVEDNPDVSEVSVSMLEQLGYQVRAVGDAEAALESLGAQQFDLVVSDVIMAGAMDGIALAREIRQRHAALPVLLVTGYSKAANDVGTEFPVLRKPFEISVLGRAASRLIAQANQPAENNVVPLRNSRSGTTARPEGK